MNLRNDSSSGISPTLTLWLSLMVDPGIFCVWVVFLTIQHPHAEWLAPVLLGDGENWEGLLSTSLGWSFFVKIVTFAVLSVLWLNQDETVLKVWHRLTWVFVGLSTFQGLTKIVLALPVISKYREGVTSVAPLELQYSRIPWGGLGFMLDSFVLVVCIVSVLICVLRLSRIGSRTQDGNGN